MHYRIADLIVEIPEAGGLAPRCKEYLCDSAVGADIVIRADLFKPELWPNLCETDAWYLASGTQFYYLLLSFEGLMLHASAVEYDGKAYLFSGHSGVGKSTHTRLWKNYLGNNVSIINDDKPALRRLDSKWYAYGTPWCGKDGINQNKKVPLAGICFLKQGTENHISRVAPASAIEKVLSQTPHKFANVERLDCLLRNVEKLVTEVPIFEMVNRPELEAVRMSFETMYNAGKETLF